MWGRGHEVLPGLRLEGQSPVSTLSPAWMSSSQALGHGRPLVSPSWVTLDTCYLHICFSSYTFYLRIIEVIIMLGKSSQGCTAPINYHQLLCWGL